MYAAQVKHINFNSEGNPKILVIAVLLEIAKCQFEGIAERKTILFLGHTYHYFFSMSGFLTFIFKRLEVPSSAPLGLLYF